VADWRAAICGEEGAPDLLPPEANPMVALTAARESDGGVPGF